jgi:hypothetical protein
VSSASVLAPAYGVTLGDQLWTSQAVELVVELEAAPLINVARVAFPTSAPLAATLGDAAVIALDGGAGDGSVTVLTGVVRAVTRGLDTTIVECIDAGALLAALRPASTFEQATAASVIGALCADAGVDVGELDPGPTMAAYVADPARSALDHIARLTAWSGALAGVEGNGELATRVVDGAQADLALRYGREIVSLRQRRVAVPVRSQVVAGDPRASSPAPPEASRPTSDFFAGDRPAGPGPGSRWTFEPALRTPESASIASAARQRSATSTQLRTMLHAWLLPALRPGTVVRLDDFPDEVGGGLHWVERVTHRVGPAGSTTTARLAEAGPAFDPMALLASAAGAIGSVR